MSSTVKWNVHTTHRRRLLTLSLLYFQLDANVCIVCSSLAHKLCDCFPFAAAQVSRIIIIVSCAIWMDRWRRCNRGNKNTCKKQKLLARARLLDSWSSCTNHRCSKLKCIIVGETVDERRAKQKKNAKKETFEVSFFVLREGRTQNNQRCFRYVNSILWLHFSLFGIMIQIE